MDGEVRRPARGRGRAFPVVGHEGRSGRHSVELPRITGVIESEERIAKTADLDTFEAQSC